jgi:hypothetical protein
VNRYWFYFEYEDLDCREGENSEVLEKSEIVDAEGLDQAEAYLYEYNLSDWSLAQLETITIKRVKFMGEVPDEKQLRFAI